MLRALLFALFTLTCQAASPRDFPSTGLVLAINRPANTLTISHAAIPGYMESMSMPFPLRNAEIPERIHPGDTVAFTLRVDATHSWIENLRILAFTSAERDPALANRLKLLDNAPPQLPIGAPVPDFTLTDETNQPVTLSTFRGKVVVIDFIYTRCPLPDYCFRLSTNFARLQKRFGDRHDLTLLTITFDPARDTPAALAQYAQIWKADPRTWHFLTGTAEAVHRVCDFFGVAYWLDEGLFTHTLHTVLIDRQGRLSANIEGNQFTAAQLIDLVRLYLSSR